MDPKSPMFNTLSPETAHIIAKAMSRRAAQGLKLAFITDLHGANRPFVCYPRDEAQKQRWLASASKKGWKVAP